MITPAFELSQDSDYLTLVIRVPYTRTSEFDICIDGSDFKFYAKPYFLRLNLPGRIVQDGREKASFDIDKGLFTMRVPKEKAGHHFEGLQMLTSLLAPKGSRSAKALVEDVGACGGSEAGQEYEDEEEEFDWQVEQEMYVAPSVEDLQKLQKYGFGNLRTAVFSRLQEELSDVIDVGDPDNSTPTARRRDRLDAETSVFCADHYLCDLYEGEEMRQVYLNFKPWWSEMAPPSDSHAEITVTFTDEEKEQMRKFPNRSHLLDPATRRTIWLGLLDIVLAYVYDVRTTNGEHNVESAWTIRKLSGTLSWLETYHSVHEVLVSFGRRVLCYPLHRHFSLIMAAMRDTAHIFQCGKACVLKCLLAVHKVFRENEPAYILNDLYITDYCVWIQRAKSRHVVALAEPLRTAKLRKEHLDLELDILEEAAHLVMEDEEQKWKVTEEDDDCNGSEEEEEEEEDSSSTEEEEEEEDSSSSEEEEDSSGNMGVGEEAGSGGGKGEEDGRIHTFREERGGGGEAEGVASRPQPGHSSRQAASLAEPSPLAQELQCGGRGGPGEHRRLIQELGVRLEEGLQIEESTLLTEGRSRSRSIEGECEALRKESTVRKDLLCSQPHRNPLRIVDTKELDSDDEDNPN
ncbi:protein SHQ1 homolog isoform X2 [Electrophorus electricus]|uniref:Protein SHQ1 homolog n=2 Tax=Electrophorus electricus TaxID=8005 RepID=A0A4W4E8P1_ELEEL|nr:protein SHQ1 homolog isoform X2 [Electrophorus electricus]XP_026855477.2 protein SHQ1 homolog isoform X2 [Electrophorus electricus]